MSGSLARPLLAFAGLAILFLALAATPNHYWDEYYYLYSVSQHSVPTLLELEGPLSDGIFPNGFFSGKIAFLLMLEGLLGITGSDGPSLVIVRSLFAVMTIALAPAAWLLLRALLNDRALATESAAVVLLLPLPVYFGFKVLSEIPSLLLAALAGWQWLRALRAETYGERTGALLLSSAGFALAILTRLPSVLFVAGLLCAALVIRPVADRRRIVADGGLVLAGALLLAASVYALALDAPFARFGGLAASVTGRTPGGLVVLYGVGLFVQLFGVVAAASLLPPVTREAAGSLAWLAIAALPYVAGAEYVEPRYFYTGVIPLGVLAALGVRRIVASTAGRVRLAAAAALIAGIAVVNRAAFGPLMLYEIRESDYSALIDDVRSRQPGATIVTPWVADYCYLTLAFPSERIVLSMSETYGTGSIFSTDAFRRWVGDRYVATQRELDALPEPHVYVGWEYSPTVVAIDRYLRVLDVAYLDDPSKRAQLLNHLAPSWIWDSPQIRLEPLAQVGAYRAFAIQDR